MTLAAEPVRARGSRVGYGPGAVPNGVEKNFQRLLMACAWYRQRYAEWPTQARMHPTILHDIAHMLDEADFQKLANHLPLRTHDPMDITVGGRGVIRYSEVEHERLDEETMRLAAQWLDVRIRGGHG